MKKIMLIICVVIAAALAGVLVFINQPQFGSAPSGERLSRIMESPHYREDKFQNLEPVASIVENDSQAGAMLEFLFGSKEGLVPKTPVPAVKTDLQSLPIAEDTVVWLGHSSFYMQLGGSRLLIDPVFSSYASPLPFINTVFAGTDGYSAADMPEIDVLVISHDHWDHLDYSTVKALQPKIKQIVCPLGVGVYFEQWGFAAEQIHEADWYAEVELPSELTVHILPAQHFSGRLLTKDKTAWAGFAFVTPTRRIFYSGDSGYGSHFAAIGRLLGDFDLAILENGQYNKSWPRIHMMPEETAQAAVDLGARRVLPVHNSKFALSRHSWQEPLERLSAASENKPYHLLTPQLGEAVPLDTEQTYAKWWEKLN